MESLDKCSVAMKRILHIVVAFLLLFAGGMVYVLFRQEVRFLSWVDTRILDSLKIPLQYEKCGIGVYFVLFCLPDMLWYAALLLLLASYSRSGGAGNMLLNVGACIPFVWEGLQYVRVVVGTFDIMDVLSYLIVLIIFILCRKRFLFKQ